MTEFFEKAYRFVTDPEGSAAAGAASLGAKVGGAAGAFACGPTCATVGKLAGGAFGAAAAKFAIRRAKRAIKESEKAKEDYGVAKAHVEATEQQILSGYYKRNKGPGGDAVAWDRKARKPRGVVAKKRRGLAKKKTLSSKRRR